MYFGIDIKVTYHGGHLFLVCIFYFNISFQIRFPFISYMELLSFNQHMFNIYGYYYFLA